MSLAAVSGRKDVALHASGSSSGSDRSSDSSSGDGGALAESGLLPRQRQVMSAMAMDHAMDKHMCLLGPKVLTSYFVACSYLHHTVSSIGNNYWWTLIVSDTVHYTHRQHINILLYIHDLEAREDLF